MAAKKRKRGALTLPADPYCGSDARWEIERDLDAITRADAVRADPNRMALVKKLAKEKLDENRAKQAATNKAIELGQEA